LFTWESEPLGNHTIAKKSMRTLKAVQDWETMDISLLRHMDARVGFPGFAVVGVGGTPFGF